MPNSRRQSKFVAQIETVSKTDAKIVVKRLRLTKHGRDSISTGSSGIFVGASRAWDTKKKEPEPA